MIESERVIEIDFLINQSTTRIDRFLAEYFAGEGKHLLGANEQMTRSRIAKLISYGNVKIDGVAVSKSHMIDGTGKIEILLPADEPTAVIADANVPFQIVFEDEQILVIDKPAGVVVHPGAGNKSKTLVNGLVSYLGNSLCRIGDKLRPGLVHRLDKDTSGLMVIAKTELSFSHLSRQFLPVRTIHREYLALCNCIPKSKKISTELSGTISAPIARHPLRRLKMTTTDSGKEAVTHWQLESQLNGAALLRLKLETGRTHQIRVHLESVGAAIIGDPQYKGNYSPSNKKVIAAIKHFNRQALHATKLSFIHPISNERVTFESPIPDDMKKLMEVFL